MIKKILNIYARSLKTLMNKPFKNVLIITDNLFIYKKFKAIIKKSDFSKTNFTYKFSCNNKDFVKKFKSERNFRSIDVKTEFKKIIDRFDLVISVHSKQLFPEELVKNIKCINIHPGFNPYNRGWYPQVFSIINKLPLGATIHEIDVKIDHGRIIDQEEIPLFQWDTSLTAYDRVLQTELLLIEKNIKKIINNTYSVKKIKKEGNLNLKNDFNKLCELNLNEVTSFQTFIDRLRALSHGDYKNAFFIDKKSGKKIFVSINFKLDE